MKRLDRSPDGFKVQSIRRSLLLGGVLTIWMAAILLRLYDLQIIQYVSLMNRAESQQERVVETAPHRGTIYDRSMHPLAMSLAVDSIYAVPTQIADPQMAARAIAPMLDRDPQELEARIKASHSFCWIERKVTNEQAARVKALNLRGIYFEKESKRFYPNGQLAATVLGYVGMDDNGLGGLEYALNSQIRGEPGRMLISADARRQSYRSVERQGEPGMNAVLTIDESIQYIAQKALDAAVEKAHALGGTVIVENPRTGAILALANEPTFDPNSYRKSKPKDRIDRAVSWIYEPGSTFKSITVSSAIDDGLAKPTDLIDCQMGSIQLGGRIIHDVRDILPYERKGPLTLAQVLMYSSDVGAVKMALRLGEDRFYRRIREYGIGSKTDVGLPGEEDGLLMPPRRWSGVSIGEIAIGQGVGVTPMQMVRVYSAIANDGVIVRPRIVRQLFRGDDHVVEPTIPGHRILSEQTAEEMKSMLAGVVERGSGVAAQLSGYSDAGKTGTAQKIDSTGHYSHTDFVSSFIGFAPAEKPAVTILVVIDRPLGAYYGAEVAAPVFRAIAQQTLCYLNVPQDQPSPLLQADSRVPSGSTGQNRPNPVGIPPQVPESTGAATRSVKLISYSKPEPPPPAGTALLEEGPATTVPNFSGLAVRSVSDECQRFGLEMQMAGNGLAVEQNPAPGTRVARGTAVYVRFAR